MLLKAPRLSKLNQRHLRWGTGDVCSRRSLYILRLWQLLISHRTAAVVQAYCWQGPWGISAVSLCLAVTSLWNLFIVGLLTLFYSCFSQCIPGICLCLKSKWSWKFICLWPLCWILLSYLMYQLAPSLWHIFFVAFWERFHLDMREFFYIENYQSWEQLFPGMW